MDDKGLRRRVFESGVEPVRPLTFPVLRTVPCYAAIVRRSTFSQGGRAARGL